MIEFSFERPSARPLRLLAIGAHSDDIEIGCGGTILRLLEDEGAVDVHWVVLSASGERGEEAGESAAAFLSGAVERNVILADFRDGFLSYSGYAVKDFFEQLKADARPDVILTHTRHDLHQDHRLVCELTWNTWRHHLVLEYEVAKYDGDLGSPNIFVPLRDAILERKIALLLEKFPSQADKHWFTSDVFRSLPRLRGVESASPTGLAEAFYGRKVVLT